MYGQSSPGLDEKNSLYTEFLPLYEYPFEDDRRGK